MAFKMAVEISTGEKGAPSAKQEGIEGKDSGFTWIVTVKLVILSVCSPCLETNPLRHFLLRRHISSVFRQFPFLLAQLSHLVAHHVGDTPPLLLPVSLPSAERLNLPNTRNQYSA